MPSGLSLAYFCRFGMLWNFNSQQLLQGGLIVGMLPLCDSSFHREFVKADEMRLDALDASLEMFIRPELILQNMNPDKLCFIHISSDRHIPNGFP